MIPRNMRQPREAPAWLKHDKQAWHGTRGQGDAAGIWNGLNQLYGEVS